MGIRYKILFILIIFFGLFGFVRYSRADWQATLQSAFPGAIVQTFDNLQDWKAVYGTGLGYHYTTTAADIPLMPKNSDGSASPWTNFYMPGNLAPLPGENIKHIANFGQYSLGQDGVQGSGKSLVLSYDNFAAVSHPELTGYARDIMYGPAHMGIYFGTPGDANSGWDQVYLFYRFKLSQEDGSLTSNGYTWTKSAHGTDEYYLNTGSPGKFVSNTLVINSKRINSTRLWKQFIQPVAVTDNNNGTVRLKVSMYQNAATNQNTFLQPGDTVVVSGTANYDGVYLISSVNGGVNAGQPLYIDIPHAFVAETPPATATMKITLGSLGPDQWSYGDNDSLGYKTIYVRLAGAAASDRDPNQKPLNYIYDETGFFPRFKPGYPSSCPASPDLVLPGLPKTSSYGQRFHKQFRLAAGWGHK